MNERPGVSPERSKPAGGRNKQHEVEERMARAVIGGAAATSPVTAQCLPEPRLKAVELLSANVGCRMRTMASSLR